MYAVLYKSGQLAAGHQVSLVTFIDDGCYFRKINYDWTSYLNWGNNFQHNGTRYFIAEAGSVGWSISGPKKEIQ